MHFTAAASTLIFAEALCDASTGYQAINQFSEARKWWRLALENDPNIENTRDKLQELDREHPPNPYRAP